MRISNYCGGYSLYEVLISITVVVIISGLNKFPLLLLIDRSEIINTADQFKDTRRHAKWLVLTKRKFHRINSDSEFLMLQKKSVGSYQKVLQEKIPSGKRRPLFRFHERIASHGQRRHHGRAEKTPVAATYTF